MEFHSRRSAVYAANGMVATSQPLASEAGVNVLRRGGNATDAALAAAAVLAVTEPSSCGLGGDAFALQFDADSGEVTALDASGRAPAALTLEPLRVLGHATLPPRSAHTVTVPGATSGFCALHQRHGRLPLAEVFASAIDLAHDGFPVAPLTAYHWELGARLVLAEAQGGQELLIDGRAPRAGELVRNRDLADVLRAVARGGARAFYTGVIADRIAGAVQAAGGLMTADDLAAHEPTWRTPLSTVYGGLRVFECPPAGQGLVALQALAILAQLQLPDDRAERLHLAIEALRLAFADARRHLGDPDRGRVPVAELLSAGYVAERAALIDPARASADVLAGRPLAGSDTVQLVAVNGDGNACSFIFSNYMGFGTGIVPSGLGFPLHNRGACFSLQPDHPNVLAPGKRPYHTIIPALATREADGSLYGPFGVMGGFMQPQGHVQVVLDLVAGDNPQQALDRPRVCIDGGDPDASVAVETGLEAVAEALATKGHRVRLVSGHARGLFGRGQIITRDAGSGVLCGGSDPRADGCAIGY